MRLSIFTLLFGVLLVFLFSACSQSEPTTQETTESFIPPTAQDITPQELASWLEQDSRPFLLDVREPAEAEIATIPGTTTQIPVGQLSARLGELDANQEIVVYCRSGSRSAQALNVLQAAGFTNVHNLTGGINAWATDVDPSMPRY